MNLLSKASEFFRGDGLVCPRCENPLEGHDEKACERRMSRRHFFGVLAGGMAVAGAGQLSPLSNAEIDTAAWRAFGNRFLTQEWISKEALSILRNNLKFATLLDPRYDMEFGCSIKIGDIATIRRAARLAA